MIQTSYFSRAARLPNAVAISQGIPDWYNGKRYKPLAPSWDIIHTKDPELYKKRYCEEVLSKLDPKQVTTDLDGCILLCHEKDSTYCHRRIVAEWLETALGIKVPEMEYAVKAKEEDSMSLPGLKAIYDRPGEYGKLGLNLYTGCSHDCRYCYNKRADRQQGPYDEPAKKATLSNIEHDLQILRDRRDRRPIYMSALSDPYDMGRKVGVKPKGLFQYLSEEDQKAIPVGPSYTRQVLERLRFYDQPFTILTKGGMLAAKDFDLYGPYDKVGVTLTFDNPEDSLKWEPGAALPADRIAALKEAHNRGIQTWVSMEPVIYPQQNLNLIKMTHEFVDFFFIDRLNRNERKATWTVPKEWPALDWSEFRNGAEALLQSLGKQPERDYMFMREEEEF